MAESGKRLEVAARSAAEIENRQRWLGFDMVQQCRDVLTHVVSARAVTKILGTLVVVLQRQGGYLMQVVWMKLHAWQRWFLRGRMRPVRRMIHNVSCKNRIGQVTQGGSNETG